MKVVRSYLTGCKWCNGKGIIDDCINPQTTSMSKHTCPVCKGSGAITVKEEYVELNDPLKRWNDLPWVTPHSLIVDDTNLDKVIANTWKKERKNAGLTLRQVAELSGISASTISRIERNKGKYYMDTYEKLMNAYTNGKNKSK